MANGGWDFTADTEVQEELANNLDSLTDQFDVRINDLYSKISDIGANKYWIGEDYDQFYLGAEGYKTAIGDLSDSIRMFSTQLKKIEKGTDILAEEILEIIRTMSTRNARSYYEVLEEQFASNANAEMYINEYEHKDEDYLSGGPNKAFMQTINDYANYSNYSFNGKLVVPSTEAAAQAWLHNDEITTANILKDSTIKSIENLQKEIEDLEEGLNRINSTEMDEARTYLNNQIEKRKEYQKFLTDFYTTKLAYINPTSSESEEKLKADILNEVNNGSLTEEHETIINNIKDNYSKLINELYAGNSILDNMDNFDAASDKFQEFLNNY